MCVRACVFAFSLLSMQMCVCARAYLSLSVRVLAWMMLRSQSAGFLPGSACLWPNTSMATAPSVKYSMKSSVTATASSWRGEEEGRKSHYAFVCAWHMCVVGVNVCACVTLQLSKTTMQ